jgi:hypothetical protein
MVQHKMIHRHVCSQDKIRHPHVCQKEQPRKALNYPRMPYFYPASSIPCRLRSSASNRLEGCPTVRAQANPLSPEVWPLTLKFALPGVGLATSVDFGRHAVLYWTQSLLKVQRAIPTSSGPLTVSVHIFRPTVPLGCPHSLPHAPPRMPHFDLR